MSTSTRLVFGFPLQSSHPFTTVPEDGSHAVNGATEDWQDVIARSAGIAFVPQPTAEEEGEYVADGGYKYKPEDELAVINGPREQYMARCQEALASFGGCELQTAGDEDKPSFFVCAKQPELPRFGDPQAWTPFKSLPDLTVQPETLEALARFCKALGIEYQEPAWYMVESWYMD